MSIIGRRPQLGDCLDGKPRAWVEHSADIQITSPEILAMGLRAFFTGDSDLGPLDSEKEVKFQQ